MILDHINEQSRIWNRLVTWSGDLDADAVALRVVAALNFLVITEKSESLKRIFPPNQTKDLQTCSLSLRHAITRHEEIILEFLDRPPQTNEVGRCAALLGGFLEIANKHGSEMEIYEPGSSAGLNLCFDQYFYANQSWTFGDAKCPVKLTCNWRGTKLPRSKIRIVSRQGCDKSPINITNQGEILLSYIWPDQTSRVIRTSYAIELAKKIGVSIKKEDAVSWLSNLSFSDSVKGRTRVVFHSIIWQYLSEKEKSTITHLVHRLGEQATQQSPFCWLKLEPDAQKKCAKITLTTWPSAEHKVLGESCFHGSWVNWFG